MKTLIKILFLSMLWFSCERSEAIYGCMDNQACNYNENANIGDGSCQYVEENYHCDGCIDESACNYDEYAIVDDGSCEYPLENFDCEGNCLVDEDACGICGGNGVDIDHDGICDDEDPCIGTYNEGGLSCMDLQVIVDFSNSNSSFHYWPTYSTSNGLIVYEGENGEWYLDTLFLANEIGHITHLRMANREITTIPQSIGYLSYLEQLYLHNNQISSIPENICLLPSTCYISVYNNNLCEEYHYDCIDNWDDQGNMPQDCQE